MAWCTVARAYLAGNGLVNSSGRVICRLNRPCGRDGTEARVAKNINTWRRCKYHATRFLLRIALGPVFSCSALFFVFLPFSIEVEHHANPASSPASQPLACIPCGTFRDALLPRRLLFLRVRRPGLWTQREVYRPGGQHILCHIEPCRLQYFHRPGLHNQYYHRLRRRHWMRMVGVAGANGCKSGCVTGRGVWYVGDPTMIPFSLFALPSPAR